MPELCGDKDLMRTYGNRTVEKPCAGVTGFELWCNLPDVKAWKSRVEDLMGMMVRTWNKLFDAESKLPERKYTAQDSSLRLWWDRLERRIENVPDVPVYGIGEQAAEAVAQYGSIVQDQACMIEEMRSHIKELGATPPALPHFKPSKPFDLARSMQDVIDTTNAQAPKVVSGLLIGGAIVGTAYVLRDPIAKALVGRRSKGATK